MRQALHRHHYLYTRNGPAEIEQVTAVVRMPLRGYESEHRGKAGPADGWCDLLGIDDLFSARRRAPPNFRLRDRVLLRPGVRCGVVARTTTSQAPARRR